VVHHHADRVDVGAVVERLLLHLLGLLQAGEPFGEMAYLSKNAAKRGADVTVLEDANIITVPTARLAQASDNCRHRFDRAFMGMLVERLTAANLRISGV